MSAIRIESLSKNYGPRVGIENVHLDVPAGSVYGFIGPNGAGKTTTIRSLMGFLRPDAGVAQIFGLDCWSRSPAVRARVGYVPGDLRLYPWWNGHEALRIVGGTRRLDLRPAGHRLAETLDLDLDVRVRQMSRGMRQKLGWIIALAHDPDLLILDEPTSGLDPLTQDRLYALIRERGARGCTTFFSSHVLSEVEDLCERVAIVRHGHLVADESLDILRSRARRAVRIHWASDDLPEVPGFLDLVEAHSRRWECALEGDVPALLDWLRSAPAIDDLEISKPDLDLLFRRYYDDEESSG